MSYAVQTEPPASLWQRPIRLLLERPLWALSIYALVGIVLIVFQVARVVSDIRYSTALEAATSYNAAISAVRAYYSSTVVPRARAAGATVSHDYADREGAIPLPATLTIELGEQVSRAAEGGRFRLYSSYPWPWRTDGGARDSFEAAALQALGDGRLDRYIEVESRNGKDVLRYAGAVVMGPTCVECHNTRADSPKRDWKVGDIRGVQSVQIPMPGVDIIASARVYNDFAFMIAGVLGGLFLFGFLLRRLKKMSVAERELLIQAEQRNEELATAMTAAESANRAKSEFLANMSHELRTPLNAIIGFSEVIHDQRLGPLDNGRYREYAQDINASGRHLLEIINDILDLAKIESGSVKLDPAIVGVESLIADSVRIVAEQAKAACLTIDHRIAPDASRLLADRRAVKQILLNLLTNAVKFTPPGGKITVTAYRETSGETVIEVADTGVGIAPELIPKAMAPFEQIGHVFDKIHGGTGLGLPLTKALIELHNGNFELISSPGTGTRAIARFPASDTMSQTRPAA